MEKVKPGGVRRETTGPVKISLFAGNDDEEANPHCGEGEEGAKAVSCRTLPSSDCCQDGDDELFESANKNQADGRTSSAICTGNDDSPCNTLLRSTNSRDITCLAGGEQGRTISGAPVEGSAGDGDGHGDGGGNNASTGEKKRKKRAVRAQWYSFQFRGMMYHIKINSSLGETYKSLATKAEQREFMIEHGEAEPYVSGCRLRAAR